MENFGPPFPTTSTSSSSPSSTLESSSSQLSHNLVFSYLPPNPKLLAATTIFSMPSSYLFLSSPKFGCDELKDRTPKKKQHSENKKAARAAASSSSRLAVERDPSSVGSETQNEQHLYPFCMPDNKKLRLLFKKELKNSDVGSLGMILPKKEAEKYLPSLSDKKGIELRIRDALSTQEWGLRYKYWTNNKSRMYLLENTGDFVRENAMKVGDSIHIYEDECKNLVSSTLLVSSLDADENLDL